MSCQDTPRGARESTAKALAGEKPTSFLVAVAIVMSEAWYSSILDLGSGFWRPDCDFVSREKGIFLDRG